MFPSTSWIEIDIGIDICEFLSIDCVIEHSSFKQKTLSASDAVCSHPPGVSAVSVTELQRDYMFEERYTRTFRSTPIYLIPKRKNWKLYSF